MTNVAVRAIVILGGGTAGWLSACMIAATRPGAAVTLVEAPDIPTIGVGEGSWPTLRATLATIGIDEGDFLDRCDASFKQGSRFDGWVDGGPGDSYYHPFSPPPAGAMADLLAAWRDTGPDTRFAAAMTPQAALCDRDLAPRQRAMPPYAGAANYGYHLDAGKFAALLAEQAVGRLGVTHVRARVERAALDPEGDIAALVLDDGRRIDGDLFIDCSGQAAALIGEAMGVGWIDRSDVSFNDRALALQVPTGEGAPIASQTVGTAHEAGWIWDIALPTRRGIGCVYAARFIDEERATAILRDYVRTRMPGVDADALTPRALAFRTGHRARFWERNCIAIGLSAGFIEPLEASAIVLIELSLKALTDNFPLSRSAMDLHSGRFNALFRYRWDRIVDFLKLHYALSRRAEPYWLAQRDPATIPSSLADQLALWADQPPSRWDLPQVEEIFSAESQQYVLYGMGHPLPAGIAGVAPASALAALAQVREQERRLVAALPTNRAYFNAVAPGAPAHSRASITT